VVPVSIPIVKCHSVSEACKIQAYARGLECEHFVAEKQKDSR
jgi:hypothetical protein